MPWARLTGFSAMNAAKCCVRFSVIVRNAAPIPSFGTMTQPVPVAPHICRAPPGRDRVRALMKGRAAREGAEA